MGLSREELFKKAKELRKKEKEEKNSRDSFSGEGYENTVYTSLPTNGIKIFRIYGDPLATRNKPTDPKLSYISNIVGDNGKKFRCVWPSREENKNWILWKIYDLVMDSTWEKNEGDDKAHRIYKNEKLHPECFRRVAKNNSENKFERGWYPTKFVNLNIIDRADPDFHKEKQHSKLLSKKAAEISEGNFWYDPGISEFAYNCIWDEVVEYSGMWDAYDIGLKKETDNPWYRAFHGVDDRKKIAQIDPDALEQIVEGPMTEEEMNYELYDLDAIFPITSYTKIKVKLGDFIKKVDIDFKKDFYEELEELAEKEKEEYKERKEKEMPSEPMNKKEEKPVEVKEKKQEESLKSRVVADRKKTVSIDWDALADGSFNGKKYLGVPQMTDEEKSMVLSVKDDGSFEYVETFNGQKMDLLNNPNSDFISPELFHVDPLSGDLFE